MWFKRGTYGLGWTFRSWEGFVVVLYIAVNVYIFQKIDSLSHSVSDTLINFAPRFLLLTAFLYLIFWLKGEEQHSKSGKSGKSLGGVLSRGGIAVIPTDTTYGIVGSALNEKTVNEIYRLRKRDLNKPFIVLIADKKDLKNFGVLLSEAQEKILDRVWPGPVSVILSCSEDKFSYLHRGSKTLAFRLPEKENLRKLIRKVGPLVAPSANPQGHNVAKTIFEAKAYFGHHVGFYQDGGTIVASPSRLIDITNGTEKVLR